jgi:hypothetical protein
MTEDEARKVGLVRAVELENSRLRHLERQPSEGNGV